MADLQLTNFTLILSVHFQFKFQHVYLHCRYCSYFRHSLIIHLFCTHICSQRMPTDFKRHWLKVLLTTISKIWLYWVVTHPVVCKHLCACFHVFCLYMCMYTYVHTYNLYTHLCIHTHIHTYICIPMPACVYSHIHETKIIHKYAAPSSNIDQRNYTLNTVSYDAWSMFGVHQGSFFHSIFCKSLGNQNR